MRLRRCNGPKPVPGSATLGLGAGVLCCGLKTRATLWCYGSVVETSSWLRYAWARCWGCVLRSKDSRYGFGALARWPKPVPGSATLGLGAGVVCCGLKTRATALVLWLGGRNQFLDPLRLGSVLGLCAAV
ncbi:hypothetical protein [Lentimonas sp. CC4]|uniref:hypothetical protein n=1 Tax=Lentimonas sp. CC4 TaxID=2676099 RepID=UPI00138977EB|nr:hypothetical protein [Lentimonas sp. CC4]